MNTRKHPPAASELVRSGRIARARGMSFERWWDSYVFATPIRHTRNTAPDSPFVRWNPVSEERKADKALTRECREAWRRSYLRYEPLARERALLRLGGLDDFLPAVALRDRVLDLLTATGVPMTVAELGRRLGEGKSSVSNVMRELEADLLITSPPRSGGAAKHYEVVRLDPQWLDGLSTPEAVRHGVYGEARATVTAAVRIEHTLAAGAMTVREIASAAHLDAVTTRGACQRLAEAGRLAHVTEEYRDDHGRVRRRGRYSLAAEPVAVAG